MTQPSPFSEETQIIIRYAHQLAQDYQHPVVFPEHLILSISAYRNYKAFQLLSTLNVNIEEMGKQCQISIAKHNALLNVPDNKQLQISGTVQQALDEAVKSASVQQKPFADSGHLLLGLLKPGLDTAVILQAQGVTAEKIKNQVLAEETHSETAVAPLKPKAKPAKLPYRFQVSPMFLFILGITALGGASAYFGWLAPGPSVFFFVIGGWVASVCLHEFGHALVAYWAGDDTVIEKGYLTLDPLKYTHGMTSIILPLIIVIMGGIGLPGGAVYINRGLIRHRYQHSLVSAAGPFATGVIALFLSLLFFFNFHATGGHPTFWAGMAMLAFLQVTSLFFNLLPLPGLDGFGILAPYLPEDILRLAYSFGQFTYILIFIVFFYVEPVQRWFFQNVFTVTNLMGIDPYLIIEGFEIFRFWA